MLTLSKYFEIKDLKPEDFESKSEFIAEWVSIYYDIDPEEIVNYSYIQLLELFDKIKIQIKPVAVDSIIIHGQEFHKIPFNKLTLGEWIDLDYFIKADSLIEVLIILYRIKLDGGRFNEDRFEEYSFFIDKRKPYFQSVNIEDVMSVKTEYIKWQRQVIESYSGLFLSYDKEEESYDGLSAQEIKEIELALQEDKKSQQFAWERIIMELVNNDLSRFNEVLKLPVIQVFNILSMIKSKANTKAK